MNPLEAPSRVKYAIDLAVPGGTPSTTNPDFWTEDESIGTPWVAIADMTEQRTIYSTSKFVTDAGIAAAGLEVLPASTLLFAMYASLGTTAVLGVPAVTNQAILGLTPSSGTDSRFLRYWLWALRPSLYAFSRSNTQDNLNAEVFGNLPFPEVSVDSQRRVADFLDRETERIEALIDKKRRLIDLLEEKRTATITHAVTKGLDPTVPMKDSGIPWIGQIPEHWKVTTVSRVATVRYGLGQPPPESEDGIPIIRATNINRGRISKTDLLYVDLADLPLDRVPLLVEGEILVVRSGALTGDSAIVTAEWAGTAPGYDLRVTPSAVRAEFLAWFFLSRPGLEQMWLASTRAAQPHLNAEELGQVGLPLPPSVEQAAIAGYITSRLGQLDLLSDRIATQLALLSEYREALITAAVTGEIDVETYAKAG